jgi:hypothetical protein
MARQQMSEKVDSKRRQMADRYDRTGRRSARQTAARRIDTVGKQQAADPTMRPATARRASAAKTSSGVSRTARSRGSGRS